MFTPKSTPLAQRLVEAATLAVRRARTLTTTKIAERTTAAILRELAASGAALEDFGADIPEACNQLADSIEKGALGIQEGGSGDD